jgi:hypothetical protein
MSARRFILNVLNILPFNILLGWSENIKSVECVIAIKQPYYLPNLHAKNWSNR